MSVTPLLKARAKTTFRRPHNHILTPCAGRDSQLGPDVRDSLPGDDLLEEECLHTSGDNAIVSLLWIDTHSKDKNQTNHHEAGKRYQTARSLIADALILGASLQACQAKKILLISPNALNICGSQLLSKFWELRQTCSVLDLCLAERNPQNIRYCIAVTKLRALELVEFRKVLVMDLSMVAKGARSVDNLFSYETPAAARNNAGLLLLKPCKNKYDWVITMLPKWIGRGSCGPLKEYLKLMYSNWTRIPFAFNFQVNKLYQLQEQPLSRDTIHRRLQFAEINIIHFDGAHSPREWLFQGGTYVCFDKWVQDHLLPNYGTLDHLYNKVVHEAIKHWQTVWSVVQGSISWYNNYESEKEGWCRGQLITCQPWVINGLNIPIYESFCPTCTKWPLLSRQEIVSIEQRSDILVNPQPRINIDSFPNIPTPPRPPLPPRRMPLQQVPRPPSPYRVLPTPPPPPVTEGSEQRQQGQNLNRTSTHVRQHGRPIGLSVTHEEERRSRSRSLRYRQAATRQDGAVMRRAIGARVSNSEWWH